MSKAVGENEQFDWLEAELADTIDEDYELELSEPAPVGGNSQDLSQVASSHDPAHGVLPRAPGVAGRTHHAAGLGRLSQRKSCRDLRGPRRGAGKGGVIKRITQRLDPRVVMRAAMGWQVPA
jgi:hypothetical protein